MDRYQKPYDEGFSGELAGSATAAQMPDKPCGIVCFKAGSTNTGGVYIGFAGVTVSDGTTDATSGFELEAGDATPWIPISNMNKLYYICDGTGDELTYIALK